MKKLTKAQVLRMYNDMVNQFGGTRGMRDEGLLDSALSAPFQTYDGSGDRGKGGLPGIWSY